MYSYYLTNNRRLEVQFLSPAQKTKGKKDLLLKKQVNPSLFGASTVKSGSPFFVDLLGQHLHSDKTQTYKQSNHEWRPFLISNQDRKWKNQKTRELRCEH